MQEFLRGELERLASRPTLDAWLAIVRKRKRATQTRISSTCSNLGKARIDPREGRAHLGMDVFEHRSRSQFFL